MPGLLPSGKGRIHDEKQLEQIAQNPQNRYGEIRNFDKQYERIQRAAINTRGGTLLTMERSFGVFHRLSTGSDQECKGCAAG